MAQYSTVSGEVQKSGENLISPWSSGASNFAIQIGGNIVPGGTLGLGIARGIVNQIRYPGDTYNTNKLGFFGRLLAGPSLGERAVQTFRDLFSNIFNSDVAQRSGGWTNANASNPSTTSQTGVPIANTTDTAQASKGGDFTPQIGNQSIGGSLDLSGLVAGNISGGGVAGPSGNFTVSGGFTGVAVGGGFGEEQAGKGGF